MYLSALLTIITINNSIVIGRILTLFYKQTNQQIPTDLSPKCIWRFTKLFWYSLCTGGLVSRIIISNKMLQKQLNVILFKI